MAEKHNLRVFLCCAMQDKSLAHQLYERLNAEEGIEPWLDEECLLPGMNWNAAVERAVEDTDAMIVCISKSAVLQNRYVQRELQFVLNYALEKKKGSIFIIPLKLDDCQIPRHVQPWQYFDFSYVDQREDIYQRLVKSLQLKASLDPAVSTRTLSAHMISSSTLYQRHIPTASTLEDFGFIQIPRGKFIMGSKVSNPLAVENEHPQHPCHIPYDYWISRYPITNEQFGEFAVCTKRTDILPGDWKTRLNHPVTNISWHLAVTYVNWLNKVFGKELDWGLVFRLPTEAEWERAARGDFGREWPWGNESLDQVLNKELLSIADRTVQDADLEDFSGSNEVSDFFAKVFRFEKAEVYKVNGASRPEPTARWKFRSKVNFGEIARNVSMLRSDRNALLDVGSFSPLTDSPYKVGDMMGSIMEWTQSLYEPYPYDAQDGRESLGTDAARVIRGIFGSNHERFSVRCARRFRAQPHEKYGLLGFRIVVAPPTS